MTAIRRAIRALLLSAWLFAGEHTASEPRLVFAEDVSEDSILIIIHARQFDPPIIVLQAGHKIHLVLRNEDAELHAFVPSGLFSRVSLNVGGNGAPEFDEDGFKKVIIPSGGRAEIRFTPQRPGVYPYLCDMPGHEMRGTIVVE